MVNLGVNGGRHSPVTSLFLSPFPLRLLGLAGLGPRLLVGWSLALASLMFVYFCNQLLTHLAVAQSRRAVCACAVTQYVIPIHLTYSNLT